MIILKNPATTTMTKKPDEVEVRLLTPGSLGAIFIGTPPKVTKFQTHSPVKNKFQLDLLLTS
jgi:hypothetical protein